MGNHNTAGWRLPMVVSWALLQRSLHCPVMLAPLKKTPAEAGVFQLGNMPILLSSFFSVGCRTVFLSHSFFDRKLDTATLVNVQTFHFHNLTFFEVVADVVHTLISDL